jgi:hypothetical protein
VRFKSLYVIQGTNKHRQYLMMIQAETDDAVYMAL